jgi:hypothetical protein
MATKKKLYEITFAKQFNGQEVEERTEYYRGSSMLSVMKSLTENFGYTLSQDEVEELEHIDESNNGAPFRLYDYLLESEGWIYDDCRCVEIQEGNQIINMLPFTYNEYLAARQDFVKLNKWLRSIMKEPEIKKAR